MTRYFTVLMQSRILELLISVLCFRISHRLQLWCHLDCSRSKDQLGFVSKPTHKVVGIIRCSVLHGPGFLLAHDWRLLQAPFHTGFFIRHLMIWQLALSKQAGSKSQGKRVQARSCDLYNWIWDVRSLDFCNILFCN